MTDVSIYTAVIAGAAGVGGAAIPAIAGLVRDVSVTRRDRGERADAERNRACLDLLRSAKQLHTKVANAAHYHGPEMGLRLEEIRACEAEVMLHAANVEILAADTVSALAASLAGAAGQLAVLVARNTNLRAGEIDPKPDLDDLDESIKRFRHVVVNYSPKG